MSRRKSAAARGVVAVAGLWAIAGPPAASPADAPAGRPNIVIVLADDLGYGDARCYDPQHAKVATPHVDRLAREGMLFTDAHAAASLCSPSRYSLLTGRYSWRSPLREHVVRMYGSPLIPADRITLPRLLKRRGYHTACVGKWHLGWNWPLRQKDGSVARAPRGQFVAERQGEPVGDEPIADGPTARGFDEYFGVDVPNLPPYTFIQYDRMLVAPTSRKTLNDRVNWGPPGPMAPGWKFDRILPTLVEQAERYIAQRAAEKLPFFLYFALTSPHEPIAPSQAFKGKSGISDVADFILETDDALGRVMAALEKHKLAQNTLLIFASDNGHCGYTGIMPFQKLGHHVGGPYRGYKCDISEGGHRVPMVARWPGTIRAGSRSGQLACLSDWMATCAQIVGVTVPANAGEDSVSLLPILQGQDAPVREDLVHQSYFADVLAIRRGQWKLSVCAGDGVQSPWCKEPGVPNDTSDPDAEAAGAPPIQLYDLFADPGEAVNVQAKHPDVVQDLLARLRGQIDRGRSTPGEPQKNDAPVTLRLREQQTAPPK
jgi:arylsulfatase A-like enzyme